MSIFRSKNKNGDRAVNLEYLAGVRGYIPESAISLSINKKDNCLTITSRIFKQPQVHLNFDQILTYNIVDEKTILEKQKSVVGRAIVGGVLLGGVGAIIGGMSGLGNKKELRTKTFLLINFIPKTLQNTNYSEDEIETIVFKITGATLHLTKFMRDLNEAVPIKYKFIQEKPKENINFKELKEISL